MAGFSHRQHSTAADLFAMKKGFRLLLLPSRE
jgi:hypothetical protein